MDILGISAFYHDSAACLVRDGRILAAAQEERFSRKKHDSGFPVHAVDYCLSEAGIEPEALSCVAFYEKPLLKFDRLIETYLAYAPRGIVSFMAALPGWLREKIRLPREIDKGLRNRYRGPIVFPMHHEAHAASAFFPSPFEEAAICTIDGVGEWSTTTIGCGEGNRVRLLEEIRFPHSLGLLYTAFTYYLGFKVNSGEYKVMGLAPYGEPKYLDPITEHLIDVRDDGSYWMDMRYFNYCEGLTMTSERFHRLFGGPPRRPESDLTQREMDLAASLQAVTDRVMLNIARRAKERTGKRNLCMAGGCTLNCVANGKILREGLFDGIFIQPAAGDAGGALGAALATWHHVFDKPRRPVRPDAQEGSYLGPAFDDDRIRADLESFGAKFSLHGDDAALLDLTAEALQSGKVVGWFQGRMEYGPRALGNRSILGDARSAEMQSTINLKIKFRESFRPFAPTVLAERCADYFEMDVESPYMLLVADVRRDRRRGDPEADRRLFGLDRLKRDRSTVPAVTHVDYSARIQTTDRGRNPLYYDLIRKFEEKTGCPVVINTSFNVRGEPIVCTPRDAYHCFMCTDMDMLVLGHYVMHKADQPPWKGREEYLAKFELD
ncbi:carbamoyltransferase [Candidatus Sumerlaeota bacterium]|nr:carbamoyltransferase [Candidatus Sumerlaeota bacterium]